VARVPEHRARRCACTAAGPLDAIAGTVVSIRGGLALTAGGAVMGTIVGAERCNGCGGLAAVGLPLLAIGGINLTLGIPLVAVGASRWRRVRALVSLEGLRVVPIAAETSAGAALKVVF
jgi:hypothetical protein